MSEYANREFGEHAATVTTTRLDSGSVSELSLRHRGCATSTAPGCYTSSSLRQTLDITVRTQQPQQANIVYNQDLFTSYQVPHRQDGQQVRGTAGLLAGARVWCGKHQFSSQLKLWTAAPVLGAPRDPLLHLQTRPAHARQKAVRQLRKTSTESTFGLLLRGWVWSMG